MGDSYEETTCEGRGQKNTHHGRSLAENPVHYPPFPRGATVDRLSPKCLRAGPLNPQTTALLAPISSPACLSHDQTGFQPDAYRWRPCQETGAIQCPAWPEAFSYTNRQHRPGCAKIPGATVPTIPVR